MVAKYLIIHYQIINGSLKKPNRKPKKCLETNDKIMMIQKFWSAVKAVLREVLPIQSYLEKQEKSKVNSLS